MRRLHLHTIPGGSGSESLRKPGGMNAPAVVVDESALSGIWYVVDIDRLPFVPMTRSRLRLAWGYRAFVAGYLGHRLEGGQADASATIDTPATSETCEASDTSETADKSDTANSCEPAEVVAPVEAATPPDPLPVPPTPLSEPEPARRIPPDRIVHVRPARLLPSRDAHFPLDSSASGRAQAWAEAARRRQQELEVATAREAVEQALVPQR